MDSKSKVYRMSYNPNASRSSSQNPTSASSYNPYSNPGQTTHGPLNYYYASQTVRNPSTPYSPQISEHAYVNHAQPPVAFLAGRTNPYASGYSQSQGIHTAVGAVPGNVGSTAPGHGRNITHNVQHPPVAFHSVEHGYIPLHGTTETSTVAIDPVTGDVVTAFPTHADWSNTHLDLDNVGIGQRRFHQTGPKTAQMSTANGTPFKIHGQGLKFNKHGQISKNTDWSDVHLDF